MWLGIHLIGFIFLSTACTESCELVAFCNVASFVKNTKVKRIPEYNVISKGSPL